MFTIIKAEILRYRIPFHKPFVTSFGAIEEREVLLCKVYDAHGRFGLGEAPVLDLPLYNPEIPDSVIATVRAVLLPAVLRKRFQHPDQITDLFRPLQGNEFAKSAVVMAAYDLFGKTQHKRVIDLIGGTHTTVPISATISIHPTPADAVREAAVYVDRGIEYLKLKIKPGFDLRHATAIVRAYPQVRLMLDANSSYVLSKKTIDLFRRCDALKLTCIEQPLQAFDIIDHATLQNAIRTPIALDESVERLYDAEKAIALGSARLINIKIARVGGLTDALAINAYCKKKKMKTWVGGMLESPIGFYANLALSTVDNFSYPIDFLGALSYMKGFESFFRTQPYDIHGGRMTIKITQPGLGIDLHWKQLDRYKKAQIKISSL